jgi:hypothetical protein
MTDRAFVQNVSTALQSRVAHLKMKVVFSEWLEDFAIPYNQDPRIIAYLSAYPTKLMDFNPAHNEETFCCPRTWGFMHNLINGEKELDVRDGALYAGTITSGVAADFVGFTSIYSELVPWKDIVRDPLNCSMPHGAKTAAFAQVLHLTEFLDDKTFGPFSKFVNRFTLDVRVLFYRMVMARFPTLRHHPEFAQGMLEVNKYLRGTGSSDIKGS